MYNYELTYIVNSNTNEELKAIYEEILELIKKNNGKINTTFPFVRRKLAYPIGQIRNAYYAVINFELEPSELKNLENKLRLKEKILRYLILKKENKKTIKKTRRLKSEEESKPEILKKKRKKEKIKLEDIQKKLDKILDI